MIVLQKTIGGRGELCLGAPDPWEFVYGETEMQNLAELEKTECLWCKTKFVYSKAVHGRLVICSVKCRQKLKRQNKRDFSNYNSELRAKQRTKNSPEKQVIANAFRFGRWDYSNPWTRIRYQALRDSGGRCMACGSRNELHVDHIKPVSKYPHLAFSIDNLQVLCKACNIGKSNLFEDDWRFLARQE